MLLLGVPALLFTLNILWFKKILRGAVKILIEPRSPAPLLKVCCIGGSLRVWEELGNSCVAMAGSEVAWRRCARTRTEMATDTLARYYPTYHLPTYTLAESPDPFTHGVIAARHPGAQSGQGLPDRQKDLLRSFPIDP